jgi:tetratricopeptide (TPR) repeat protein
MAYAPLVARIYTVSNMYFLLSCISTITATIPSTPTITTSAPAPAQKAAASAPAAKPSAKPAAAPVDNTMPSVDEIVNAAEHLFVQRSFKKLRELSADIIKRKIGGKTEFNILALACRARLENEKYADALDAADRMIQLDDTSYLAHYLAGRAHLGLKDPEDAGFEMQRALMYYSTKAKNNSICADQLKHAILEIDIRAGEAESLYELGKHVEAADKLNVVMGQPGMKADEHLLTLHVYAKICLAYAKWSDCVRSLLRAISANQNDKTSKKLIVDVLKIPEGYSEMRNQIPAGPQSAAVLAFLGVIARDEGAFPLGIRLLAEALKDQPGNANFALTLTHLHESNNDTSAALQVLKQFLSSNSSVKVAYEGRVGFSCADLGSIIDLALNPSLGAMESADVVTWVPYEGYVSGPDAKPVFETAESDGDGNTGYAEVFSADRSVGTSTDKTFEPSSASASPSGEDKTLALDLLAIAFTAVKMLYVRGQLAYLPQLIRVVEPTRRDYQRATKKAMHETSIRNEHAYYLCVMQVCAVHCERQRQLDEALRAGAGPGAGPGEEPTLPERWLRNRSENLTSATSATTATGGKGQVIYICGDSHCIPPAWSTVSTRTASSAGEDIVTTYTLVPKLVTGLKHWHLRPDSHFYPKMTFLSMVSTIPDGATVSSRYADYATATATAISSLLFSFLLLLMYYLVSYIFD